MWDLIVSVPDHCLSFYFNLHRGLLSLHRGPPVNVPIRRTAYLFSAIPANDTKESIFGHRNCSSPAAGIESGTSNTRRQCTNQ